MLTSRETAGSDERRSNQQSNNCIVPGEEKTKVMLVNLAAKYDASHRLEARSRALSRDRLLVLNEPFVCDEPRRHLSGLANRNPT